MKVAARVMDVTTTLQGEKVGMTIDQGALAHIMSVLTDLYSDPEMAVLREYSTNALDAHVEARTSQPIEVTLPSPLSPFLRIRDYGVGLDADDIRDIYSRYGTSTKRNSNDVVGMLGLGCKSALTYSDQFTLSGTKFGVTTQVSVSRDEDGSGSMTIVDQFNTSDPSGVEIIVPAKQGNSFEEKAQEFFRFWTPGTVLVNGKQPKRIDGLWIADDLLMTDEVDGPLVIMGNVPYPAGDPDSYDYRYRYRGGYNLVAFVPIGAVQFTPSRESLQMTKLTKDTLTHLRKRQEVETQAALKRLVSEAPSYVEAIRTANRARRLGLKDTPQYKGEDVPAQLEVENCVAVEAIKRYRGKGWVHTQKLPAEKVDSHWFTGYMNDKFTPYKREKLVKWLEQKGISAGSGDEFLFVNALPKGLEHWIDPKNVHPWTEVDAIKIEREARAPRRDGRPTGSYPLYDGTTFENGIVAGEIQDKVQDENGKQLRPLFWLHSSVSNVRYSPNSNIRLLLNKFPDAILVILSENRVAKFTRDFPQAKNMNVALQELANKWEKSVTDEQRLALAISYEKSGYRGTARLLDILDPSKVDDPAVKDAITSAKIPLTNVQESAKVYKPWVTVKVPTWKNPLDTYPLVHHLGHVGRGKELDDLYLYLNAAYAAKRKEG